MKFNTVAFNKDINNYFNSFASAFVKDAIEQIEQEANDKILYFYNDYTPMKYIRTNDFRDNSVMSNIKSNKNSKVHTGYVDLLNGVDGGNSIYSNKYKSDIEIRNESWMGIHGNLSIAITTPSPLDYILTFFYRQKFKNSAINKAKTIAASQKFTYLKK